MKYQRPTIIDLSAPARAAGQGFKPSPDDCVAGATPTDEGLCVQGGIVIALMCNCYMGTSDG